MPSPAKTRSSQRQQKLSRSANNLRAVREITAVISAANELPELLTATCQAAVRLFGVDHSGLVLFDEQYDKGAVAAEFPAHGTVGTKIALRGVAIEEQLIYKRQPVIIPDVAASAPDALGAVGPLFVQFSIRSILIVPIVYGQRVLGSFSLDMLDRPFDFDADVVEMCQLFAAQVAIAIAKDQQLERLLRHTMPLTGHLQERELFARIADEAAELLNTAGAGVYVYDQGSSGLRFVAGRNITGIQPGVLLPLGEGLAGRLYSSGEPFMMVDDYSIWSGRALIFADECPAVAVVAAPLRWADEILGVLFVSDPAGRSFTRQDGNLLRLFADSAGGALIDNEKMARMKRLSQTTSLIMRNLDQGSLEERLNLIAREAVELLGAESSGVMLVTRPSVLRLVAGYGHRPEVADIGREFVIASGAQSGLTGAIAMEGRPTRLNGDALTGHPAVRGLPTHTVSTKCHSLLALPLFRQRGDQRELLGLIRIDNKKDRVGRSGPNTPFTDEDEQLFGLFGEAVSTTVENATYTLRSIQLINSSPSCVVVSDDRGIVTTFSAQAETMLGYRADEVEGKAHVERLFEDNAEPLRIGRALQASSQPMVERRARLKGSSGQSIPVRLSATAYYDALGQRRGTIGYFEDLRPLVAKEQQLQRMLQLSETLRQIGDYFQSTQQADHMLRVFLYGVTAPHGLQCDHAALLLFNEHDRTLRSAAAIGPADSSVRHLDFEQFISALRAGALSPTPLELRMHGLSLPVDSPAMAALDAVLDTGRWSMLQGDAIAALAPELLSAYAPAEWLMAVPLMTATRTVGLLLADRRQGGPPLTQQETDLLMALAGTTALALSNTQLLYDAIAVNAQLRYLFQAGSMMVSSRPPRAILNEFVGGLAQATDALWVTLFLIDAGLLRDRISTRERTRFNPEKAFRSDGVSMEVIASQDPQFFADTSLHRGRLNPVIFSERVGSTACIPFVLRGKSIGVVWIHTAQPRSYSDSQRQAIQLFVNQAVVAYESAMRGHDLDLMRQASDALARTERWEDVLQQIGEHARAVLKAHKSIVWFYDRGREQFVPEKATGSGIPRDLMETMRRLAPRPDGTTARALHVGRIVVEDARDPRQMARVGPRIKVLMERCGAQSLQIIALRLGGESLGALYALYDTPRSFGEADAEQSQLFAENAAHALKKAMLLDRVSMSYLYAREVTQATVRGDLPATLHELANGIKELMTSDIVSIYVYDEKRDRVDPNPIRIGVAPRVMNRAIGRSTNPRLMLALSAQAPIYVSDVRTDGDFRGSRFVQDEGIRSTVAVPLRVGDTPVGAMFISYREPRRFSPEDQRAIAHFAEQASVAINTTLLALERNEQLSALKALHQAAYALTTAPSLDELFQIVVEQAVALVRDRSPQDCFAHYARLDGRHLRFAAAYPLATLQGLRELIGDIDLDGPAIGVTGQALRKGMLCNLGDVSKEVSYLPYPHLPEIRSELAVPVLVRGVPVGVINLESPEYAAFTAHDEYAVEALARYVAVAIETTERQSTHAQTEYRERRLKVITELTDQVAVSADLGELLRQACDLIVAGSDRVASIWLYDELEKALTLDPSWSASFKTLIASEARHGRLRLSVTDGICGWVVQHKRPFCSGDVTQINDGPRYVATAPKTVAIGSELCVPIIDTSGGEEVVVGVIDLQSSQTNAFDDRDEILLHDVARVLSTIIAREQTRQRLSAAEGVALTGMAGSLYWHQTVGLINNIQKRLDWLHKRVAVAELPALARETIGWLEERTKAKLHEGLPPLLDPRENQLVSVHQLLREVVIEFSHHNLSGEVHCSINLPAEHDDVQVRANGRWLGHALLLLLNNAATATRREINRSISVSTRCLVTQSYIEISVGDNGHGISPDLQQRLFREQIQSTDGMGVGALLVRRISETYGGYVRIADPGPYTTSIVLALPIAHRATDNSPGKPERS